MVHMTIARGPDVHCRDGSIPVTARVLGVGHGLAPQVLEEDRVHARGLLVLDAGDTLDAATASQTADDRLGDALDVVAEPLDKGEGPRLGNPGGRAGRGRGLRGRWRGELRLLHRRQEGTGQNALDAAAVSSCVRRRTLTRLLRRRAEVTMASRSG
eukprot:scaffold48977_cov58-Phaeocystis_antarctica.AAC.2